MAERDLIITAIEKATHASSIHNSQPWRFEILGDAVAVSLDASATPRTVDPEGRWALASIGAVLANLELTLQTATGQVTATELRIDEAPASGDLAGGAAYGGRPLAVVSLTDDALTPYQLQSAQRLADVIADRFTTREPLLGGAPTETEWESLRAAVATGNGDVSAFPASSALATALLELTARAETERQDDPDYLTEIQQWISNSGPVGIPEDAVGLPDAEGRVPTRDFTQTPLGSAAGGEAVFFEADPALLLIVSDGQLPHDQLLGGYAMQRAMLEATSLGLGVGVLGQALEGTQSRDAVDEVASREIGRPVVVHQILRVGHPGGELHHPHTPRRPVTDVVTD